MPLLGFSKERLDPDPALAHRLLVRRGLGVAPDSVEVGSMEGAADDASLAIGRALLLDRTGVADRGSSSVGVPLVLLVHPDQPQLLTLGTAVPIALGVVGEVLQAEEGRCGVHLVEGDEGRDPQLLDGADVRSSAVSGVSDHPFRTQLPAEEGATELGDQDLMLGDIPRRDERHPQAGTRDDPGSPTIDQVMVLVAESAPAIR